METGGIGDEDDVGPGRQPFLKTSKFAHPVKNREVRTGNQFHADIEYEGAP